MLKYSIKKLANNLTVLVVNTKKLSSLDITLYIKVGSIYENEKNNGISHLLEHLISINRHKKQFYPFGLDFHAFTHKDYTHYEITVAKKYVNEAIKTFGQIIKKPAFLTKTLKKVKTRIFEEIADDKDDPYNVLCDVIDNYLYSNSSLRLPILGTKKNIQKINLEKVRSWYIKYYQPDNMILTIIGDVENKKIEKLAEKYLDINKNFVNIKNKTIQKNYVYPRQKELEVHGNFERSYLTIVYPIGKLVYPSFLEYILLWYLLNQKFESIAENSNLFYDMNFDYSADSLRGGYYFSIVCDKKNINKIKKKIFTNLDSIKISKSFFGKTKKYFINNLILKKDYLSDLSSLTLYMFNSPEKIITVDNEITEVEKVTLSEIQKLKTKVFAKENHFSFVLK